MAVTLRRVQASNIATNVTTNFYTVPTGKRAIVRSVFQGYDGGVVDAGIGLALRGVGYLWDQKVSNHNNRLYALSTVMNAGDQLAAFHSQPGMYTMVQVAELDAAEGETLWKQDFFSLTTGARQTATVPAGKRIRVREVVICNHGDTVEMQVYINGITYFVKSVEQPRTAGIYGVDLSANPGEVIGAYCVSTSGGAAHVFLSGVMEDA